MSQPFSIPVPRRPHSIDGVLRVHSHFRGNDLLVVTVEGELDLSSAGLLRRALWQDLPPHTVLDLSGVTFLAVAGLRVLEEAVARARLEHRRVGVVAPTRPVARVLRLFRFDRMPVYDRLADAVRELPATAPPDSPVDRLLPESVTKPSSLTARD